MIAGILGYSFILIITLLQGIPSTDLGKPTIVLALHSFGSRTTNLIFSIIIAISLTGWYVIQTNLGAISLTKILKQLNIIVPHQVSIAIVGLILILFTYNGYKQLEKISKFTSPLFLFVFLYSFTYYFRQHGISTLVSYTPTRTGNFIEGIFLVVGSFIVGAILAGDFTRFNKSRNDTIKSTLIGILPFGIFLLFIGYYLSIITNNNIDITTLLSSSFSNPYIVPVTLLIVTIKINLANAYSAGIALTNAFQLKESYRGLMSLLCSIIAIFITLMEISNFLNIFLVLITNLMCPIASIMIVDYWIRNKGNKFKFTNSKPAKNAALFSYLISVTLGLILYYFSTLPFVNILLILVNTILPFFLFLFFSKRV